MGTRKSIKQVGNDFEYEFQELLASNGFWAHLLAPDKRGAQPFDIVATKNGKFYGFDCKTCLSSQGIFPLSRVEENQYYAFKRLNDTARYSTVSYFAFKRRDGSIWLTSSSVVLTAKDLGNKTIKAGDIPFERWMSYASRGW